MASASPRIDDSGITTSLLPRQAKPAQRCCYRGFHWTHLITIPGVLAGTAAAIQGFLIGNHFFAVASVIGALASGVGAITVSRLKPQKDLETDTGELDRVNRELQAENESLKRRIGELGQTSHTINLEVVSAEKSINGAVSDFHGVDQSLQVQLSAAGQREAELKRLLGKYQESLTQMTAQVHAMSSAETAMGGSLVDLHSLDAHVRIEASEIGAAASAISREENELETANRKFSELSSSFQQKIELLAQLMATIKASHAAMTDRVAELEKVESELDQTKQKLEHLIPQMNALVRRFAGVDGAAVVNSLAQSQLS